MMIICCELSDCSPAGNDDKIVEAREIGLARIGHVVQRDAVQHRLAFVNPLAIHFNNHFRLFLGRMAYRRRQRQKRQCRNNNPY